VRKLKTKNLKLKVLLAQQKAPCAQRMLLLRAAKSAARTPAAGMQKKVECKMARGTKMGVGVRVSVGVDVRGSTNAGLFAVNAENTGMKSLPASVIAPPSAHKGAALLLKLPKPQISILFFITTLIFRLTQQLFI
jgi:hypothetical protein